MEKEIFRNYMQTIGLWKGWDYTPTAAYKTTSLNGLLEAVTHERPNWANAQAIVRLQRLAQGMLLKTREVSHAKIRELINWDRSLAELVLVLNAYEKVFPSGLRRTLIELRSARMRTKLELFKSGVLGFTPQLAFDHHNRVVVGYLDAIQARMQGTQTSNQTLEVQTVEVGAGYAIPAESDTAMGHIIGSGKVPGEMDVTGYQTTWITHFELADNNGATTTVATVTDSTHFTLTSATGFQVGDRICVEASSPVKTTISALSGVNVTTEDPIPGLAVSNPAFQIWGESGLKGNADGTTLFTHSRFSDGGYIKKSSKSILVESAIIERGVA